MRPTLSQLIKTAVITGLLAGQSVYAEQTAEKKTADPAAMEKNSCKGQKTMDKNSCKGAMAKKKKSEKNSCKNGCGEAKSQEETK